MSESISHLLVVLALFFFRQDLHNYGFFWTMDMAMAIRKTALRAEQMSVVIWQKLAKLGRAA